MGRVYEMPSEPPVGVTVATPEGDLFTRVEFYGWVVNTPLARWNGQVHRWFELLNTYKRLQEVTV